MGIEFDYDLTPEQIREIRHQFDLILEGGEPVWLEYFLVQLPFLMLIPEWEAEELLRKFAVEQFEEEAPLWFLLWTPTEAVSQFFIPAADYHYMSEARRDTVSRRWRATLDDMQQKHRDELLLERMDENHSSGF